MIRVVQFRKRPDPKRTLLGADVLFLKKATNFVTNRVEYKLRQSNLHSSPIYLTVQPSGFCQLHCPLCPVGQKSEGRKRGLMDPVKFEQLMEEIGDYLLFIHFSHLGEPLLNEGFYGMVDCAKRKRIYTVLSTNLNHLPNPNLLVSSGLDSLNVSIDGASEETYLEYRRGGVGEGTR